MSSGVKFDPDAIRALAQILKDTDLTEIELVEKDSRIRVARMPAPAAPLPPQLLYAPPGPGYAPGPPAEPDLRPAASTGQPVPIAQHPGLVASPMVGVAYLGAEPGAPAYVGLGARVTQGQTLLLIEAMKTFNQIRSPRDGTVTRILIENGTPVEYGEPLMIVE